MLSGLCQGMHRPMPPACCQTRVLEEMLTVSNEARLESPYVDERMEVRRFGDLVLRAATIAKFEVQHASHHASSG